MKLLSVSPNEEMLYFGHPMQAPAGSLPAALKFGAAHSRSSAPALRRSADLRFPDRRGSSRSLALLAGRTRGARLLRHRFKKLHRERILLHNRDFLPGELFNLLEIGQFVKITEGESRSLRSGTAGPADPMDIGFRLIGKLKVDDMRKRIDIDSARGNIGGNQYADFSALKVGQRLLACPLGLVAVNRLRRDFRPV